MPLPSLTDDLFQQVKNRFEELRERHLLPGPKVSFSGMGDLAAAWVLLSASWLFAGRVDSLNSSVLPSFFGAGEGHSSS